MSTSARSFAGPRLFRLGIAAAVLVAVGWGRTVSAEPESAPAEQAAPAPAGPPVLYAVIHGPGSGWKDGVSFREQPGIMEHVQYYSAHAEEGRVWSGGPFLDDSGGMMLLEVPDADAAKRIAQDDPKVKDGLLTATVRPWMQVIRP